MLPVAPGIFRGPQPKDRREFAWLAECGIKTIIDLENESVTFGNPKSEARWERDLAQDAGISFDAFGLSAYWIPDHDDMTTILDAMVRPDLQPILVHCRHGQDRTGLVVAMYRRRFEGWTKRRAWAEMLAHGFHPVLLGLTWYFWMARTGQTAGTAGTAGANR